MYGNLYSQNNMSQVDTVLQHLVAFGKISPEIASDWYGIKYLPKCISRLRKRKINIKKRQIMACFLFFEGYVAQGKPCVSLNLRL